MRRVLLFLALLAGMNCLQAQTNPAPVRLALVAETGEAEAAVDLLTAKLSGAGAVELLEREAIEKVYQEQSLSAAHGNGEMLKAARILGADGLLLLNIARTAQATNLTARLIAVKPGVILGDAHFDWPLKNTAQWPDWAAAYLNPFLPKLAVLPREAIPLSVVNLRSAVNTAAGAETERQLKALIIQRLSEEPRVFVLERQRMQLLGDEKELKADDSAFWDGSYLLEGTVDQNGFSPDRVTINARLTPPQGSAPLLIEASGSRTNLAEVINQLAVKIMGALKINSTVKPWNAADEAANYFDEANWAMRWGVLPEARAAADSAWALGKQDLDCATVRVRSYLAEEEAMTESCQSGMSYFDAQGGYNADGKPLGGFTGEQVVLADIKREQAEHPWGFRFKETADEAKKVKTVEWVFLTEPPDAEDAARAIQALELYDAMNQLAMARGTNFIRPASGTNGGRNSDWYELGIEDLVAASRVLQNFNLVPEAQEPVADKLAVLRKLIRSVADFIENSPGVRDGYFVGNRIATYDELSETIGAPYNIFRCEVDWGCFWQERPEDTIALYRKLMSSPVFCYIHEDFWNRDPAQPRLAAWSREDEKNIPAIWESFMNELASSTNLLLQMEAKALARAEAPDDVQAKAAYDGLRQLIKANREALVANNVDLFYDGWGLGYSDPEFEAMDQEYRDKTITAWQTTAVFEKQKKYLRDFTPFEFMNFEDTFRSRTYTEAQLRELLPLIAAYKSNLVARAGMQSEPSTSFMAFKSNLMTRAVSQSGMTEARWVDFSNRVARARMLSEKSLAQSEVNLIEFSFENQIRGKFTPIVATSKASPKAPAPKAVVTTTPQEPALIITNAPEVVSHVLTVGKFSAIPLDELKPLNDLVTINRSELTVTAHGWADGKLLLNFEYSLQDNQYGGADGSAIALLDPKTEQWEVIGCPKVDFLSKSRFARRSALLGGQLYNNDGGKIEQYDFETQSWKVLSVSDGNNYELFAVNGHLYAADGSSIFEISDDGQSTRILASTRRRPPASALDTQLSGTPTLFEGPNHTLRVVTSGKVFSWTGSDWREECAAPTTEGYPDFVGGRVFQSSGAEVFPDGVIFREKGVISGAFQNGSPYHPGNSLIGMLTEQDVISVLANDGAAAILYLKGDAGDWWRHPSGPIIFHRQPPDPGPKPLWKTPKNLLPGMPVALRKGDLYLLEDAQAANVIVDEHHEILKGNTIDGNAYNAALLCFSREFPDPQKIYLKFESPGQKPADWILPTPDWLLGWNAGGVWMLPIAQLDAAIQAQQQVQRDQKAQAKIALEQARRELMAKYDRNHNGVIDPDEREAGLDDPAFIESQLDVIDANHNGELDPEELAYFDANQDKILEPNEQAGIDLAQHLLAQRDLQRFDTDENGFLDQQEFGNLIREDVRYASTINTIFSNNDTNRDGWIDQSELESYLRQSLRKKLHPAGMHGVELMRQLLAETSSGVTGQQIFKLEVEAYWRDPASITNPPVFSPGHPYGFTQQNGPGAQGGP